MSGDQKRKHVTLTLRTKIEILKKIENGETLRNLANFYGVGRATVHDIKKRREKILNYVNSSECRLARQIMKSGEYPEVESALYEWFLQERAQNNRITGDIIREKAKSIYNKITNKDDFKASDGWLDKFKKRFGIRLLNNAETNQFQENSCSPIQDKFLQKIREMNLLPDQIYTANESVLLWKLLPHKKYINMSRDQLMFMHCLNSTATHKLKLFVLGNVEEPSVANSIDCPVLYKTQNETGLTPEVLSEWFYNDFVPSVSEFLTRQNLPHRALLILSNSPNNPIESMISSHDGSIQIMFLDKHCTYLPPAHGNISHMIKSDYKKDFMYKAINQDIGTENFLTAYTLKDALLNLALAWEKVFSHSTTSSWASLRTTHLGAQEFQSHGYDDFVMNTEFVEDVFSRCAKNEPCTREDVRYWLSPTYDETMSMSQHEELVNDIKREEVDIQDVAIAWTFEPIHAIKDDEALDAINTCIRWGEENNMKTSDFEALNRIRETIFAKTFSGKAEDINSESFSSLT